MKVLSLFSGIGAFEKALDNLGVPYELEAFCEIDKYASKSYAAIHGVPESMNIGDITKVDARKLPKDIALLTYGFPCQDISNAGKMKGLFNADGSQTRSGLFFEALRIIEETQPKVAIAENVKMLTSKKFAIQFKIVLDSLKAAGYNNYWQVLNAKDYGIPQNRERVFIVSIRKDIDNGSFKFPEAFPLELRSKDMLEDDVDEKFYLQKRMLGSLVSETNTTTDRIEMIGMLDMKDHDKNRRVYGINGVSPALNSMQGGNRQPKIAVETERVISVCNVNPSGKGMNGNVIDENGLVKDENKMVTAAAMRGRYDKDGCVQQHLEVSDREFANALTTVQKDSMAAIKKEVSFVNGDISKTVRSSGHGSTDRHSWDMVVAPDNLRIRKLTPKECFRLMGFEDADFEKAEAVNSNAQLYKQAGNSIVVPVVQGIIQNLFDCGALEGVN